VTDGFGFRAGSGFAQESSPAVHYDAWSGVHSRHANGGSYRHTAVRGATLALDFRGRRLTWVTATGPAYGRAKVVVDGHSRTADLFRPHQHWKAKVGFRGLGAGEHHLTVKLLGRKDRASRAAGVVVDALLVLRR